MSWEFCTNLPFLNWDALVSIYNPYQIVNLSYSNPQPNRFRIFSDELQLRLGNTSTSGLNYSLYSSYPSYQSIFPQQLCFNYQTTPTQTVQTDDKVQTGNEEQAVSVTPTSSKLEGFDISKYPKAEVDAAIKLYQQMGLDKRGLNKEVFLAAVIGYNRLTDKGNGYLAIVDTTQNRNAQRYYLVDMKNKRFVDQTAVKLGKNSMDNARRANIAGSNASLSGFMKFGIEYESPSANAKRRWKRGIKLHGIESGINNNALSKGVVAHCTELNTTAGCIGIPAVLNNDRSYNYPASFAKLRKFCPSGAIVFTAPTGTDYWQSSKIFA